jgi:hypothetical protein
MVLISNIIAELKFKIIFRMISLNIGKIPFKLI